jgi:hypothetical protein
VPAFARGNDVVLASRVAQSPLVVAHELAHVAQQRLPAASRVDDRAQVERDAHAGAAGLLRGEPLRVSVPAAIRTWGYDHGDYEGSLGPWLFINESEGFWGLDEFALGGRLFDLAWMGPDHYDFIERVIDALSWGDRDDVANGFALHARDFDLDEIARTEAGRHLLRALKSELLGGFTAPQEGGGAVRMAQALFRYDGAEEGRERATQLLTDAAQRGTDQLLDPEVSPVIPPDELEDRYRLIQLILERIVETLPVDLEVGRAVAQVQADLSWQRTIAVSDPVAASTRVVIAQRIVERAAGDLDQLDRQLDSYTTSPELGAARAPYVDLTTNVRVTYVTALEHAFADDAARQWLIAQEVAGSLPQALTEVDLGILAHRQAGYATIEPSAQEMTAWVLWVRDRLAGFQAEARELGEARGRGDPDVDRREEEFRHEADLLQLSLEGIQHWDRGLTAHEYLVGGMNLFPGAYSDAGTIMQRCAAMRDAAYADDLDTLRVLLEEHRTDPNVEQFYQALPIFTASSQMLVGFGILLVATIASAGAGSLIASGATATTAEVVGSVALEALTFTMVQRTLQGAILPGPRLPFLLDLALNFGLFGLMRVTGSAIRSAMKARGLVALTGLAQHGASYGILQVWGALHFRIEEGRWPTGDELVRMSAESLVMLAGIAVATRGFARYVQARQQLHALEALHQGYGSQLAEIDVARRRLTLEFRDELAAGRGDDQATIDRLRAEAEAIEVQLDELLAQIRADPAIGVEALRTAMADLAANQATIGGELLSRSLGLADQVSLRRSGGDNQYTYSFGATPEVIRGLEAIGARVRESTDATGRKTVRAEIPDGPTLYLAERMSVPELRARLARLAGLIEGARTTHAERQHVIGDLRTPPDRAEPGELEGHVLDAALAENQRAIAELAAELGASQPDVIVGMERGGAFLADVLARANPDLAGRVRKIPVHHAPDGSADKFDGPLMQAEIQALIDAGARKITIVDVYMGGRTARSLRDQVLKPLAARNPGVEFDVQWIRELMGFDGAGAGSATSLQGRVRPGQVGGGQITSTARDVRMAIGDDMSIVYDPDSRAPVMIFDREGNVTEVIYPGPGETTRDVLIRLLTR